MNLKEITLDEIELHEALLEEGASALVHTILFLRAPNIVKPMDHVCERLAPLRYAKCGPSDVDEEVTAVVHALRQSLTPVGPYLAKGMILCSFFERRETKGFFGLVSNHENVYFERWLIPVVVDQRSLSSSPSGHLTLGLEHERQCLFDTARDMVTQHLFLHVSSYTSSVYFSN